jgi:hypothetical protein
LSGEWHLHVSKVYLKQLKETSNFEQDVLGRIKNSKFDRDSLNLFAEETGSGRTAVEKDFVIPILLMLISNYPKFRKFSGKMVFRGVTCIKKRARYEGDFGG